MRMAWQGLGAEALCVMLKDPARNDGRSLAALEAHLRDDPLVAWGFEPAPDASHRRCRNQSSLAHKLVSQSILQFVAARAVTATFGSAVRRRARSHPLRDPQLEGRVPAHPGAGADVGASRPSTPGSSSIPTSP